MSSIVSTGTINDKLPTLKRLLRELYDNYFTDNKLIVSYLRNIEGNEGDWFENISKKVLSLKIPSETYTSGNKDYVFIDGNLAVNADFVRYKKLLATLLIIVTALKHYVLENTNYTNEVFTSIATVKTQTADVVDSTGEYYYGKLINYTVVSNILTVSCDKANEFIAKEFTKPADNAALQTALASSVNDDDTKILLKYLFFMLKPKPQNIRRQVVAFYYYIRVLNESFQFFFRAERLIAQTNPDTGSLCNLFNDYYKNVVSTNDRFGADNTYFYLSELREFNTKLLDTDSNLSYINTGKISTVCPLKITFSDTETVGATTSGGTVIDTYKLAGSENTHSRTHNDKFKGLISPETHDALIQYTRASDNSGIVTTINKPYRIKDVQYVSNSSTGTDQKRNKLLSVTLYAKNVLYNATSTYDTLCNDDEYVPVDDIAYNATNRLIQIKFQPRTDNDLTRTFYNTGTELTNMNESITESKDKINAQVKTFQLQNDSIKAIDTRMTVYYSIFAIIAIVVLVILLLDIPQTMKIYVSVIVAVVLLIMSMINYFWNYNVIETFGDNDILISCANINSSATFIQRVRFVNAKIPDFTRELVAVLDNLGSYINRLDSVDMKEKLAKSLNNERRTFQEHSEIYKYKQDMNSKSMDIMKHDMIKKTAYMNMLTINFFVLALVLIFYMVEPAYVNTYLTLAIVLIVVNLLVYYFLILHPVRTAAKNKYWIKPSDSVLQNLS
jgi:hypothetical protein